MIFFEWEDKKYTRYWKFLCGFGIKNIIVCCVHYHTNRRILHINIYMFKLVDKEFVIKIHMPKIEIHIL